MLKTLNHLFKQNRLYLVFAVAGVVVLVTAAVLFSGVFEAKEFEGAEEDEPEITATTGESRETGATIFEDIPDVVAIINGEEILKKDLKNEFQRTKKIYEQQGIDLTANEEEMKELGFGDFEGGKNLEDALLRMILQDKINTTLLLQQADKAEISIVSEEVELEYESVAASFQSEQEFESMKELLGYSDGELRERIKNLLKVSKVVSQKLEQKLEEEDLEIDEERLREAYEGFGTQVGDVREYDEAKAELDEIMADSKIQQLLRLIITELHEESEIEIFMN